MKTRKRPIIHSYYQHVADKFWPVFLPIALVGAAWFVWKVRREVKNR